MKVGIMSFEESLNSKTLRGVFTTTRYLQENLKGTGLEVDLLVYGNNKLGYPTGFDIVHHCRTLYDLSKLKEEYDFMIYFTPGRSWEKFDEKDPNKYIDVLEAVSLPFTTIYHSEEYKTHQPYRMNFIRHRDCKFITFITEGFKDIYKDDLDICNDYAVALMLPPMNPLDSILDKAKSKNNSVIITSAWTNFKRNREYFELAEEFAKLGIDQYSAGAPSSSFYLAEIVDDILERVELQFNRSIEPTDISRSRYFDYTIMMSRLKQDIPYTKNDKIPHVEGAMMYTKSGYHWYDYGAYYPEEISELLMYKKFHWNMSSYKINKAYVPRLEIVTVEALNEGCLPIICKETTPDWITDDSAIRLSKKDYAGHLDILKDMSTNECISRISKFYDLVKTHLYDGVYEALTTKIREVVK